MKAESTAVLSGIGVSQVGRRLFRDPIELASDACAEAIADAGLEPADIDGLATYPGESGSTPGISGVGIDSIRSTFGLRTRWHAGGAELPGQLGAVVNAVLAVAAGFCEHVLCFRSVWESTAQVEAGSRSALVALSKRPELERSRPYGVGYATFGGLAMKRYMHESGATREQLAQLAVVSRRHAAGNRSAVYQDPLTADDYLAARMISDPLCLYDCDVPVDGAVGIVVSRSTHTVMDRDRAIGIEAIGTAPGFEPSAEMMWSRTDLKPSDVDVAEVYDGFTIYAVRWLEALGLTPRFETGQFMRVGTGLHSMANCRSRLAEVNCRPAGSTDLALWSKHVSNCVTRAVRAKSLVARRWSP